MSGPAIIAKDITVKFRPYADRSPTMRRSIGKLRHRELREVVALDNLSCTIPQGDAMGVIGRNGAGKTTLLRVLAGTLKPDSGVVEHRTGSPTLLQLGVGFNGQLSGRDNILLGGLAAGHSRTQMMSLMDEVVDFAEIGDAVNRPVNTYSSGQRSRLAFAIAMTLRPTTLMVDEIMAVGDAEFKAKSFEAMQELIGRAGTVVMVSHSLPRIKQLCETAMWIDQGKVRMIGQAAEVVDAYADWARIGAKARSLPDKPSEQWSGAERTRLLIRLMAGEAAADLAVEGGVTVAEIREWRRRFTIAGRKALHPRFDVIEDDDDDDE